VGKNEEDFIEATWRPMAVDPGNKKAPEAGR
jgi:hypothetical protein